MASAASGSPGKGTTPAQSGGKARRSPRVTGCGRLSLWPVLWLLTLLPGCDGQWQAASSSPFNSAPQSQLAPAQAGLEQKSATSTLPAAAPALDTPTPRQIDSDQSGLPTLARIPLRGKLEEDLVYEGALDPQDTQALVRALEAAVNRDLAAAPQ